MKRSLSLRREVLAPLDPAELRQVKGADDVAPTRDGVCVTFTITGRSVCICDGAA